jgi:hypothetical protein
MGKKKTKQDLIDELSNLVGRKLDPANFEYKAKEMATDATEPISALLTFLYRTGVLVDAKKDTTPAHITEFEVPEGFEGVDQEFYEEAGVDGFTKAKLLQLLDNARRVVKNYLPENSMVIPDNYHIEPRLEMVVKLEKCTKADILRTIKRLRRDDPVYRLKELVGEFGVDRAVRVLENAQKE